MSHRRPLLVLLAALALFTAVACGTTEPAAEPGAAPAPGGPIALTDASGRAVTLPGPATRVVGLEWTVVEHVVSLGVMPVGVADPDGYANWVRAQPLDPAVRDVGVRGEPSIDAVAALRPDLILATESIDAGARAQMEAFAPVVTVRGGDAADPIAAMRSELALVGRALGRDAAVASLLDQFDAKLADGRARLAGSAGQRFLFMDGFPQSGQVVVRVWTDGSLVGAVTTQLGLVNAWTEPGDRTYGLAQTDVEGLTRAGEANALYVVNEAEGGDPFRVELGANPVWNALPFVRSGRVDRLPDGIWYFGGPTSMAQYIDAVVAALGSRPR